MAERIIHNKWLLYLVCVAVFSLFVFLIFVKGDHKTPEHLQSQLRISNYRNWIGPDFWTSPLQDWSTDDEAVYARSSQAGYMVWLTKEISPRNEGMEMSVYVRFDPKESPVKEKQSHHVGFRLGVKGYMNNNWLNGVMYHRTSTFAGINADGQLLLGEKVLDTGFDVGKGIQLSVKVVPNGNANNIVLEGKDSLGKFSSISATKASEALTGGLALLAGKTGKPAREEKVPVWEIKDWKASGSRLDTFSERTFGPILWTQYTLSKQIMKLSAQFPPLADEELNSVYLQERKSNEWKDIATAQIDPISYSVLFKINNWDDTVDHSLRVSFKWHTKQYFWPLTVRKDPKEKDTIKVAVLNCDNGYQFPQPTINHNLTFQNPDLVAFLGDQIYELETGGFGAVFSSLPQRRANLDYLRKWYHFGWQYRELLRNRPSISIPDDHDVYHYNLFGAAGRALPKGARLEYGGYRMSPEFVNMVQRTQTSHLPDPYDPRPVDRGIGVYFTDMLYGDIHFAILEDRKWKTGPDSIWWSHVNRQGLPLPDPSDYKAYDVPGLELLGERQEVFLDKWVEDHQGKIKVVFSQSIFAAAATHLHYNLDKAVNDLDSNGWPQTARNRVVRSLGEANAITIHGDQHFGMLAHLGADNWEDGPVSFLVTGSANGFPRAWWPDGKGKSTNTTGRFLDDFGNKLTVLAVANPDPSTGKYHLGHGQIDPESIAHVKGSGYGFVHFNKKARKVKFEMWRVKFDAKNPKAEDQFPGFPYTVDMDSTVFPITR